MEVLWFSSYFQFIYFLFFPHSDLLIANRASRNWNLPKCSLGCYLISFSFIDYNGISALHSQQYPPEKRPNGPSCLRNFYSAFDFASTLTLDYHLIFHCFIYFQFIYFRFIYFLFIWFSFYHFILRVLISVCIAQHYQDICPKPTWLDAWTSCFSLISFSY